MLALLNQTVSIANRTGRNSEGQPSYGAPTQVPARVQDTKRRFMDGRGMEIQAKLKIFLPSTVSVDIDDRITYGSTDYTVLEKYDRRGWDGNIHHLEVFVV